MRPLAIAMTTPPRKDPRRGRAWQRLTRYILARDRRICWRCGHTGADTVGHILSYKTHPHLALEPSNLRAEHGTRRRHDVDGFDCVGNFAAGADAGHRPTPPPARRQWLA